jgi:chemotaxis protein MotA
MIFLIGLALSFSAIILGYKGHGGEIYLLLQPWEFLIVIGASIGSAIFSAPKDVVVSSLKSTKYLFNSKLPKKEEYLEVLCFFFNLFRFAKAKGIVELEKHVNLPQESLIFQNSPFLLQDLESQEFVCSTLRLTTFGITEASSLSGSMTDQINTYQEKDESYANFYLQIGDSLPAFGIVAAVMGVVVAMKSIGEPPAVLGSKIAAALVGTFCGILLAYVIVAPIGSFLYSRAQSRVRLFNCMRAAMVSYATGHSPMVIVELTRIAIPDKFRPSFQEAEEFIQQKTIKIT